MVRLTDGVFILSCCLVLANHILWFQHFSHPRLPPDHPYSSSFTRSKQSPYDYSSSSDPKFSTRYPTFPEISAFFGICVWMVPFSLFVSLSASENVLPSTSDIGAGVASGDGGIGGGEKKKKGQGLAKALFGGVGEWLRGTGQALGVGGGARRGRFE
ncbi:erv26 superfamily protein [Rhizina undulata]